MVFALDPTLAFRNYQLLKLKYDELLSTFAFNCNLRHYTLGQQVADVNVKEVVMMIARALEENEQARGFMFGFEDKDKNEGLLMQVVDVKMLPPQAARASTTTSNSTAHALPLPLLVLKYFHSSKVGRCRLTPG